MKSNKSNIDAPKLHEITPQEQVGRDTIARYQAQFRAAAYECLSLLEDIDLDRVYCDYQDDFVTRFNYDGNYIYNFYQVKTKKKRNHQWGINEIFGLYKKLKKVDVDKINTSFAGKLLLHTIKFRNSCGKVVFLTNVHFDDDVEAFLEASQKIDKSNKHYSTLVDNFNSTSICNDDLDDIQISDLIKKLDLKPNISYLEPDDENFSSTARSTIFKYSEIDLSHNESEEIINNLVSLVQRKSFKKQINELSESELDEIAGIGLEDMLDILSISKGAYKYLKEGGDKNAIKNASIIHRLLKQTNATESMIEYVSRCKVDWDIWFRDKRHMIAEFDLNFIQEKINQIAIDWARQKLTMDDLELKINELYSQITKKNISSTLNEELILGGIFSATVRNESQ